MRKTETQDRIADAGVDVAQIAQTRVLIKVGEFPREKLRDHPVWPLCRSLGALGFGALHIQGAIDYFEDLAYAMPHANLIQTPGIWTDDGIASTAPSADFILDLTNDPESKSLCASLCRSRSTHLISLAFGRNWMGVRSIRGDEAGSGALHCRLGGPPTPISAVSRIASGAVLQEMLIVAGAIAQASPPESEILYNVASCGFRKFWPPLFRKLWPLWGL